MPNSFKLYDILEVSRNATPEEIKDSYRKLVRLYHPDKTGSDDTSEQFRELHEAYKILSDAEKRARYDLYGDNHEEAIIANAEIVDTIVLRGLRFTLQTASFPLQRVADRLKVSHETGLEACRNIWKGEGIRGYWRGSFTSFTANLMQNYVPRTLVTMAQKRQISVHPMIPITVGTLLAYPLEVVATCVRTNTSKGIWNSIKSIVQSGGILGLFNGIVPFMLHQAISPILAYILDSLGLNNVIQDYLHQQYQNKQIGKAIAIKIATVLAKVGIMTLVTCPLRSVTVRLQVKSLNEVQAVSGTLFKHLYAGYFSELLYNTATTIIG